MLHCFVLIALPVLLYHILITYACVCLCVCVCVCVWGVFVYLYVCPFASVCVACVACISLCVCAQVCVRMRLKVSCLCLPVAFSKNFGLCTRAFVCVCVCVCMCVDVFLCVIMCILSLPLHVRLDKLQERKKRIAVSV
jgi:hypothetical protein